MLLVLSTLLLAPDADAAELRVVATVPSLAAIAREVAGDHSKVTSLSLPTQDPHFVDARPSLALEVAKADAVVLTGLDLELGWLPTLLTGSRNAGIQPGAPGYIDCSGFVTVLGVPVGRVDRSMGDIHGGGNPHYHPDPRRAKQIATGLAERLAAIDPDGADTYRANATRFVGELDTAITRWEQQAAGLKGQPIIDFHRSWPYLEDWLGFEIVTDIEPKPGIPPTPKHVLHVVQLAQQRQVKLVIQESWFPTNTSEVVASKSGARVVVLDAQARFQEGQSYIAHVDAVVNALTAAP